ncbi:MAG TPA: carboxypeptidase-like regulatory domain-containing protein, partial [Anseongella sp.]|nr:carboxypeptidase-like regulatory domain-containing protein [Anseongella sp.]
MKIRLFILSALLTLHLSASSQNGPVLSGTVSNERSEPLAGASVNVLNTNFSTFTDNTGRFLIKNISGGEYVIQVAAPGYAGVHRTVSLPGDGELSIRLVRSAEQLDAVTVTAQKREEDLQRVPLSISTLPAGKVQEYRLWNSKDLKAVVPNLYAAHPGDNRNVISVRGITTTSYDPAVATYIDGVNQFGLDTYIAQLLDIERIEVLRGPQGT